MPNSSVELISVHIPKCAGTSFAQILARNYPGGLRMDYEDQPLDPQMPFQRDFAAWKEAFGQLGDKTWDTIKVIHGHFWARKYDCLFPGARKITWLRHPIKRLVSHYFYWKSVPEMPHSLHKLMREQNLSLIEFAQLPQMQNILRNVFLRDVELNEFACVGIHEHFAEDLEWLRAHMKWPRKKSVWSNRTVHSDYRESGLDSDIEKKLRNLNQADLELYEAALEMRARRIPRRRLWFRILSNERVLRALV